MPALNDARFACLRSQGFTGATNDMLLSWLKAKAGVTAKALPDAWRQWLTSLGFTGAYNEAWFNYLGSLGHTGSLNDRELKFWVACSGSGTGPPTVDAGGPYTGTVSVPMQLNGTVTTGSDPNPVILWTRFTGPTGTFGNASVIDTTWTADSAGPGQLRLSADPNDGIAVLDFASYDALAPWTPAELFAAGEQGAWYDPSDFSTMFQLSTGTTAVTTFNQPVGYIADKSGRGNHATQSTVGKRPVTARQPFGGRRNLLTQTDVYAGGTGPASATQKTLSFTGTGTITLSGAFAGTLVGTGAGNRVSLTFTSTAASLTVAVAGSVTLAQLEYGAAVTAYQKVTVTQDVTEAGKADCWGLMFDGVDDSLLTPVAVDMSVVPRLSIVLGRVVLNREGFVSGSCLSLGAPSGGVVGSAGLGMDAFNPNDETSSGVMRGTSQVTLSSSAKPRAELRVAQADLEQGVSLPSGVQHYLNGVTDLARSQVSGSAAFGSNLFLGVGAVNQTSNFYKGILFSTCIHGEFLSTTQRQSMTTWVGNKTGLTL